MTAAEPNPKPADALRVGGVVARIYYEAGGTFDHYCVRFESRYTSRPLTLPCEEGALRDLSDAARAASAFIDWGHGQLNVVQLAVQLKGIDLEYVEPTPWRESEEATAETER